MNIRNIGRRAFTLIELLVVIAIICILGAVLVGGLGGCSVSDGTRTGTLTKFACKGFVKKSWEGEMVLGGIRQQATKNGTVGVANVWAFSVLDKKVAENLDTLVGHEIKVKYHQVLVRNPINRDTPYEITSVEDLSPADTPAEK